MTYEPKGPKLGRFRHINRTVGLAELLGLHYDVFNGYQDWAYINIQVLHYNVQVLKIVMIVLFLGGMRKIARTVGLTL